MSKNFFFQAIQFNIQKQFHFKQLSSALIRSLNFKTCLFQTIQFSISTQFSSIWAIDMTLSGATIACERWLESDGIEVVLHIFQSFNITGTSEPRIFIGEVLTLFREAIVIFASTSQLGKCVKVFVWVCVSVCVHAVSYIYSETMLNISDGAYVGVNVALARNITVDSTQTYRSLFPSLSLSLALSLSLNLCMHIYIYIYIYNWCTPMDPSYSRAKAGRPART